MRSADYGRPKVVTTLKLPEDIHEEVRVVAQRDGVSANRLILTAIQEYLERRR